MENDRKLNVIQIVYVQQDKDNYRLVRFTGMDHMRAELRSHGIIIGQDVNIGREVLIADGVTIGSGTRIASEATLEHGAVIGSNCIIGTDAFIGRNTRLGNNVSVGDKTELGRSVIVGDGAELSSDCIVQDHVHIGHASRLHQMSYVGSESVLGHHTVIGAESRLGRMVLAAPSTVIDSHRVINSFMSVSGTDGDLHQDEELKRQYAMKGWPAFIGGERAQMGGRQQMSEAEQQKTRRIFGL